MLNSIYNVAKNGILLSLSPNNITSAFKLTMLWNIFLVLFSVLNTYSLPTISLIKSIQIANEPKCPVLRDMLQNCYPKLDYLKSCANPFDPNSSNALDIRCNLYLSQFNLLCASALSYPEVCLTREDFEKVLDMNTASNVLNDTCRIFGRPLMGNNNSEIDDIVVKKCSRICTDIRTDKIDMLCLTASYFRMIVLKTEQLMQRNIQQLPYNTHKTTAIDLPTIPKQVHPILQQPTNKTTTQNQEDIMKNTPFFHILDESGNGVIAAVSPIGDTKPETSPKLTDHVIKDNTVYIQNANDMVLPNENGVSSQTIGNAVNDKVEVGGDQTSMPVYPPENILANSKPILNDIPNTNAVKPNVSIPLAELKSIEKAATSRQLDVDSSSTTTLVKNDIIEADDLTNQNTAQQSDYSDGRGDFEKNPADIDKLGFENHVSNVKHPGMTENEDDTINQNLYRDVSTVQDDSYFFTYFMMLCIVFIFAYVGYHNKQKIIAIVVEGRRGNSGGGRGGRSRGGRRPNSANYHKLDSNLEEAVSSNTTNKNTSKVIY